MKKVEMKKAVRPPGASQSNSNLRQIGLAFHNHHDQKGYFPTHAIYSKDGKNTPLLSWRVAILPYIEQDALYKEFKLDEPWDSAHNKKLVDKMPQIYTSTGPGKREDGKTFYVVFTGPMSLFDGPRRLKFSSITDGTSNTALVFEGKNPVVWTKPEDLVFPKEGEKLPELGGLFKEGMNVLFADGSTRWTRRDIPAATLRAIITPSGGEVINDNDLEPQPSKDDLKPPPAKDAPKATPPAKVEKTQQAPSRMQSVNNLKQIGLAMHAYHDANKRFPLHAIYSKDGKPLLSWRVAILPFVDESALYNQFKLDEPWDSEHNKKLISKMPVVYKIGDPGEGKTHYVVFTGPMTVFDGTNKIGLASITDGASNTGLVFEGKDPVIWTKPDDLVLPKKGEKLPEVGGVFKGGFNMAFCDGSVRWVTQDIDPVILRSVITRNGGEVFDLDSK